MQAPQFSLPDQDSSVRHLSDFRGSWVILYFYPKDDTPGCTKEACGFRDTLAELTKRHTIVLGVSKDSVNSHKKFVQKFSLAFPLLSDPTAETISAYGAWGKKKFMGKSYMGILRKTVLIDPSGAIRKTYDAVDPVGHAQEILEDIDTMTERT